MTMSSCPRICRPYRYADETYAIPVQLVTARHIGSAAMAANGFALAEYADSMPQSGKRSRRG